MHFEAIAAAYCRVEKFPIGVGAGCRGIICGERAAMKIIDAHTHIGNFGSWARFDFDLVRLKEQMAEFDIEKTLLTGAGFHDNAAKLLGL